ncbi:MAG: hypothetical protein Q9195_002942 [Heterodermia aff. obscurata]
MYNPDASIADSPLNPEALQLISLYTMLASLVSGSLPDEPSPKPTTHANPPSVSNKPISSLPTVTITVDTSTNILGHGNTIQLPSPTTTNEQVKSLLETSFQHLPDGISIPEHSDDEGDGSTSLGPVNVEVKVKAGINICGSKNVVVLGGGALRPGHVQGIKRKAEGDSANMPETKKAANSS